MILREPWELTRSPTIRGFGRWSSETAAHAGGHGGLALGPALLARRVADGLGQQTDVLGRRAAAAADDLGAVVAHEGGQPLGQLLGPHRVLGASVDVPRDAGVRDDRDRLGDVLAQPAHRLAQVLGADGAVQADDVGPHGPQDRGHRGDVRAEQHPAGHVEGHLGLDRHRPAGLGEGQARAVDGRPQLEDVLHRLDDQQVRPAHDQAVRLLAEELGQLVEADLRERRVVARRAACPWGPSSRPRSAGHGRRVLVAGLAGEPRGLGVELERDLLEPPLLELEAGRLE